jgi:uncharacterized protein (AIM24 family)
LDNVIWMFGFPILNVGNFSITFGAKTDSQGNILSAGRFQGRIDLGDGYRLSTGGQTTYDMFLTKYSTNGMVWVKSMGGTNDDMAYGCVVDSSDNVIVTGFFSLIANFGQGPITSTSGNDIFVAKYNSDGSPVWTRTYGAVGITKNDWGIAVSRFQDDSLIVVGTVNSGAIDFGGGLLPPYGSQDIFVLKLDSGGNYLWAKRFGGTDADVVKSVCVDKDNNVVMTGTVSYGCDFGGGGLTNGDVFVTKLGGSDGHFIWSRNYDSGGVGALGVASDPNNGNIVIASGLRKILFFAGGTYQPVALGNSAAFLACYDTSGTELWGHAYGGQETCSDYFTGVAIDPLGNIAATGSLKSAIDLGNGWRPNPSGGVNYFHIYYNEFGQYVWSKVLFPATGGAVSAGVSFDLDRNMITYGSFGGEQNFGGYTVITTGGSKGSFTATYRHP